MCHYFIHSEIITTVRACECKRVILSLCLINRHAIETYGSNGCIAPRNLNLGTRRNWVSSFMPGPSYTRGKSFWYKLYIGLGGLQSQYIPDWEERNICSLPEIEPLFSDRSALSLIATLVMTKSHETRHLRNFLPVHIISSLLGTSNLFVLQHFTFMFLLQDEFHSHTKPQVNYNFVS